MMWIGICIILLQTYVIVNLSRKLDQSEDVIEGFYTSAVDILSEMRRLDDREMFEKDDEVGHLWSLITDTIGELRYTLYGETGTEEDEESLLDTRN